MHTDPDANPATALLPSLCREATTIPRSRVPQLLTRGGVDQGVIARYLYAVTSEPAVARAFEAALGIKRLRRHDDCRVVGWLKRINDVMAIEELKAASGLEIR
jgi:hypothetical protein